MHSSARLILVLALLVLASGTVLAKQSVPGDLIGSYLWGFEWGGTRITLKSDGTFTMASSSCTSVTTESGPYSFSDGLIRLTTLKITMSDHGSNKVVDLRKSKARKEYLDTDEPFKPTEQTIQVTRWGNRIYLMDKDDFGNFINAINLGFEPRKVESYRAMYGVIFLREGDEAKQAPGDPQMPAEFLSLLLREPITATITGIESSEDGRNIVTIDRGSNAGLRKDITLVYDTEDATSFSSYSIVSLTPDSAKVEVYGAVAVGDKLTTRVKGLLLY